MNRGVRLSILCAGLALVASALSPAMAHPSTGTDLNTLAFDHVWPLVGPGGPGAGEFEDLLEPLGFWAQRAGGVPTPSTTHHNEATHTPTFFQCDAAEQGIDLQVVPQMPFFHSDLENAIFEATGTFFVDLEFTGSAASRVDSIWFFYLSTFPWPISSTLCSGPFPLPGAYVEFVTGDLEGRDGWEIPVNSLTVPDMAYGAGIRAFDADGNVLKTGFVYANVNNYLNDLEWTPGTPSLCAKDPDNPTAFLCPYHDVTPPFPSVKGAQGHLRSGNAATHCGNGVAFEYGEPLKSFTAGAGTVTEFPSTPRDSETVPLLTTATDTYGPSYCVTGATFPLTVTAVDQSDNIGLRTVTSPTPGSI